VMLGNYKSFFTHRLQHRADRHHWPCVL